MGDELSSGETVRYDEYGMRLRTGRDPGLRMEAEGLTISDIGDSTPVAPISPTTGQELPSETATTATTETTSESLSEGLEDLDVDDIDTSDLDETTDEIDVNDEDVEHIASFDNLEDANKHISKLNSENAAKRVALKPYREAFQNFNENEQGQLLGLMHELGTSPETAATKLIAIGNIILGRDPETASTSQATETGEEDLDKPLTLRELQTRQEKEAKDHEFKAQVDEVFSTARDLGYKDNTVEQRIYLGVLANEAEGDSAKAHQLVEALFQRKIKEYVDGKRKQRDTATANPVPSLNTEIESHNPRGWKEATAAAIARGSSVVGQ